MDITVANAGAGSMCFHVLTLTRAATRATTRALTHAPSAPQAPAAAELAQGDDTQDAAAAPEVTTVRTIRHTVSRRTTRVRRTSSTRIVNPISWPPGPELMMVVDGQGRVLHCTIALAERLGRTVPQVLGNGLANAMESLIAEPFAQLHRALVTSTPNAAPPPHSCRSGLAVLMQVTGAQGRRTSAPFRLFMRKRMGMDEPFSVCSLQQCTLAFALDERRLLLELDAATGLVQSVSNSPAQLFGFDPRVLVGKTVASCLDIFKQPRRPTGGAVHGKGHAVAPGVRVGAKLRQGSPTAVPGAAVTHLGSDVLAGTAEDVPTSGSGRPGSPGTPSYDGVGSRPQSRGPGPVGEALEDDAMDSIMADEEVAEVSRAEFHVGGVVQLRSQSVT